jgi:hypothetical protein
LPSGEQELSSVPGGDPEKGRGPGRGARDQGRELPVELGDLTVEERNPPGETAQRKLGGD